MIKNNKYKRDVFLVFFLAFSWGGYANAQNALDDKVDEQQVEVILGIDKIERFDFKASPRVQLGNTSIVGFEIFPSKKEITFKGKKAGKTSVTLRDLAGNVKAQYVVTVTKNSKSEIIEKIKEFVGHIEGIEIGIKGDFVYIGGKLVVPSDMGLINITLKKFPDVMDLVELAPQSQVLVGKKMQDEIHYAGMKDVTIRIVNKSYWLEGIVESEDQKKRTFEIVKAYLPDSLASLATREGATQSAGTRSLIQNFIQINRKKRQDPIPKLIKIAAQFVELSKDYNRVFGFRWQPLMASTGGAIQFGKTSSEGLTTRSQGTLAGTISNLFPKLASAKSAGQARVVQSGVIITQEKIQAKIKKSSSKPFAIGTGEFVKAEKAESGFDLSITPTILPKNNIDMKLGIAVSAAVGDPPETVSNEISTSIVVKTKDSAVVGGVVIDRSSTDYDRNPPFAGQDEGGGTPLFSFLRSKSYTKNKSQFVVFITPEVIDNASEGTLDVLRKFRGRN